MLKNIDNDHGTGDHKSSGVGGDDNDGSCDDGTDKFEDKFEAPDYNDDALHNGG